MKWIHRGNMHSLKLENIQYVCFMHSKIKCLNTLLTCKNLKYPHIIQIFSGKKKYINEVIFLCN